MTNLSPTGLYCAYLRKSRKDLELEALGQGETLARHDQTLRDLADRLGIRIMQTYREVVSGDTIAERPEVRHLLEAVNAGTWDGVLVMDVDRLGRGDSIDQGVIMQSFLYSGTLIITPDKIYDPTEDSDAEFFEIKLFFSRREYAMIKKRMQRGRLAAAMDGCYSSPRPVYGYERCKLQGRKGWSLKPVPEKAEIVRAIFDWYAHGMDGQTVGAALIADRLNQMGLRTYLGHPFTPSTIRGMLQNPIYVGKVQWNQRQTVYHIEDGKRVASRPKSANAILVDGRHEPIVDQALFDEVQGMFSTHEKRPKNKMAPFANPLGGLVICGQCGHRMQLKGDPTRRAGFVYCPTQRCPTCSTYLFIVEDAILAVLASWVAEFEADPNDAPVDVDSTTDATESARQQLADTREGLTAQLNRLYDLLEQGVYTVVEFRQRREDINARIAQIDADVARLDDLPRQDPRASLVPQLKTVLATYQSTEDPEQKNALLRSVIDHVVYHKTQRCYRNNALGDNLSIEVYPRIPAL